MTEVWTIYGGDMWRQTFNGVVTIIGSDTFGTLKRIVGLFGVLGVMVSFVKSRNPMVFMHWLAIFFVITSVLLVPKRSVQIIDITDPAAVYEVDNVPAGLAGIAGLSTSAGFAMARLYEYSLSRPDSLTYTKSGMLFGSNIVAQSSDFRTQNPELGQMLNDYVENCVVGDILLNNKYTVAALLNSRDPLTLITDNPSPLRGVYQDTGGGRQFITCQQASGVIKNQVSVDTGPAGATFHALATRLFGNRVDATSLLSSSMNDSYNFFYAGGQSASQIMRNNITNAAIRSGWKGFAARSSDTANLLNMATESSLTKQRISWGAGGVIAARTLPMFQSLMMLILIGLFPLVIALSLVNHSIFGMNTLKLYAGGFLYFQMWPVMFAILNSLANFYLQTKTGNTALVLANQDQVALQHSDAANIAGYLSMSIPILAFFLTKGAASVASQAVGGVMSSAAFATGGQASTTADGNWSFNNMSMDNVNANKFDTNMVHRSGSQAFQTSNGSMHTQTSDGSQVYDTSGAISNLPVNMRLSQLATSGFQEQARLSDVQAQSALDGYNHSVTSSWNQLSQVASQTGKSDSLSASSDNSQANNIIMGTNKMISAAESYAKANNISNHEAYNKLMDISNQGSASAGIKASAQAGIDIGVAKAGVEGSMSGEVRHATSSSRGTQEGHSNATDNRHDQNSQMVEDFRQGRDMVSSSRVTDSGNHTENASTSRLQQLAATMNDATSQYQQYTTSKTHSDEMSRMASLAQNQSASLDTNYTQEFVNWSTARYGARAQDILVNAPSARVAASEFVKERLAPEIMDDYQQGRRDLLTGDAHQPFTLPAGSPSLMPGSGGPVYQPVNAQGVTGNRVQGEEYAQGQYPVAPGTVPHAGTQSRPTQPVGQHDYPADIPAPLNANPVSGPINRSHPFAGEPMNVQGGRPYSHQPPVGNPYEGKDISSDYVNNNGRLTGPIENAFPEQTELARKVAEQRSANERNISDSAGEISKKESTVQASSDKIKGEMEDAINKNAVGRTEALIDQQTPVMDSGEKRKLEEKLRELRKKTG